MAIPLPQPKKEAAYVGKGITFHEYLKHEIGDCEWCDTKNVDLNVLDGNDGIIVKICIKCERMARTYSKGGFSILRALVPVIQQKRKEQIEVTGKQACEFISKHWAEHHSKIIAPEKIWNYSSTGELSRIWEWHAEAKEHEERIANAYK